MQIVIITPQRSSSRSGNGTTTARWERILRQLGHSVRVAGKYAAEPAELMIALHAWRSAESIARFRKLHPERPLIVALSGTDIYDYIDRDPKPTLHSLACADRLVALQELAAHRVPERFRAKVRVIHQSAPPVESGRKSARCFEVAVIGHLREVKDPFRAAQAARDLPASSRIRIVHLGAPDSPRWRAMAQAEMRRNPRYIWRGDRPRAEVRRLLGRARAMVLASVSEGGANAISEAVAAGVPILASHIDGSVGLLGRDYPGYFPVGDTAALTRLLHRIETDARFLLRLRRAVARRMPLFRPAREQAAWQSLLLEIARRPGRSGGAAGS
ncbi:MAG: TIGR04348 family glycosyltransferase [Alphaproteobacteria bacterium]|nr:MAG: TIGR04348 family glycosyltransferase [Alphaproteobacteria bacterium]